MASDVIAAADRGPQGDSHSHTRTVGTIGCAPLSRVECSAGGGVRPQGREDLGRRGRSVLHGRSLERGIERRSPGASVWRGEREDNPGEIVQTAVTPRPFPTHGPRRRWPSVAVASLTLVGAWAWLTFAGIAASEDGHQLQLIPAVAGGVCALLALLAALSSRWRLWLLLEVAVVVLFACWVGVEYFEGSRSCSPDCPPYFSRTLFARS